MGGEALVELLVLELGLLLTGKVGQIQLQNDAEVSGNCTLLYDSDKKLQQTLESITKFFGSLLDRGRAIYLTLLENRIHVVASLIRCVYPSFHRALYYSMESQLIRSMTQTARE